MPPFFHPSPPQLSDGWKSGKAGVYSSCSIGKTWLVPDKRAVGLVYPLNG